MFNNSVGVSTWDPNCIPNTPYSAILSGKNIPSGNYTYAITLYGTALDNYNDSNDVPFAPSSFKNIQLATANTNSMPFNTTITVKSIVAPRDFEYDMFSNGVEEYDNPFAVIDAFIDGKDTGHLSHYQLIYENAYGVIAVYAKIVMKDSKGNIIGTFYTSNHNIDTSNTQSNKEATYIPTLYPADAKICGTAFAPTPFGPANTDGYGSIDATTIYYDLNQAPGVLLKTTQQTWCAEYSALMGGIKGDWVLIKNKRHFCKCSIPVGVNPKHDSRQHF